MDATTRLNSALEGRYRIERELGEGGMARVFLADDLRHDRKVAVKVLKPELAAVVGAERFLAEIKTTANLQHPHILPLYDSGEADSLLFYVMPYVEGESLRERLDREHQLPVDDAVRIATNMAEALDYAHRQGVIHRDIKPANVLLQDGKPVISDFGIALAVSTSGAGRMTETGLSLGTAYYMSPEQATGDQNMGPATDIYALGCVLYETLVGEPPFTARSPQAVLAQILTGEAPAATEVRPAIPLHVDAVVRKALEKLPADRFASSGDLARALGDPGFRHGEAIGAASTGTGGPWRPLAISAVAVAFLATAAAGWALLQPDEPAPLEVFELSFRPDQELDHGAGRSLSDDGTTLVYTVQSEGGEPLLWVRRWDDPQAMARPIAGTEGALHPVISPDGTSVMFLQDESIKILPFDGAPPVELPRGMMPAWGPDGFVYASWGRWEGVFRVPAGGGPVDTLSWRARGEIWHVVTDFLPDGSPLLTVLMDDGVPDEIRVIDLETGVIEYLLEGAYPRVTASDHLVFDVDGTLTASAWDTRARAPVGPRVPLVENVSGAVELSATGKLVYTVDPSQEEAMPDELVWIDRSGQVTPVGVDFNHGEIFGFGWSLSPDGSRIALRHEEAGNEDIWVKQLPDGPFERLTVSEASDWEPWWAPDGRTVTYVSAVPDMPRTWGVWSAQVDGVTAPTLLHADERRGLWTRGSWTPDGAWLVATAYSARDPDIVGFRPGVDSLSVPLIATEFREHQPALSPDGRWLAYASDRTGRSEIYVRPFPDVNASRLQVSTEGGLAPSWAHGGEELFFLDQTRALVSARVETDSEFSVSRREKLFTLPPRIHSRNGDTRFFDVAIDDQRFLMGREREQFDTDQVARTYLANNFLDELKRRVPN